LRALHDINTEQAKERNFLKQNCLLSSFDEKFRSITFTCKITKKFVAGLHTFVLYSCGRAAPRGNPYVLGLFLMDYDPRIRGAPRTMPALNSFSALGWHVTQCIFRSAVWGLFQRTKSYFDMIGVPFFEISPNLKFFSSCDN